MNDIIEKCVLKSRISELNHIAEKIINNQRISVEDAILLYEKAELGFLSVLSEYRNSQTNGKKVFFNRNFHIEPTNICVHNCRFCSFSRKRGEEGGWEYSLQEMLDMVKTYANQPVTEAHIVGGVHPGRDLEYYAGLLKNVKKILPHVTIKAFTAVELDFMIKKSGLDIKSGLLKLKEAGLEAIPGGGAEIFSPEIRKQICHEKSSGALWLTIHETAHSIGLRSNATMLYGHIENYAHRTAHLDELRHLQDKTNGFSAFIPLKYRQTDNSLSNIGEVSPVEDLRNFAVCRLFLDNFKHIKAYWPMLGKELAQVSLSFGVNDIDGTINDTTKIYSMAGVEDKKPDMSLNQMIDLIKTAKKTAVERDTFYNELKIWS